MQFLTWLAAGLLFIALDASAQVDGTFFGLGGLAQGCNGRVNQTLELPDGDLLVAGDFTACGQVASPGVARFNGKRWFALGEGVNGEVMAVANLGTDIYAAGEFSQAGTLTVNNIARFDGQRWHRLGSADQHGVEGIVLEIAAFENKIYVAGYFFRAGPLPNANGFAVWDGVQWQRPPGDAFSGAPEFLSVVSGELYVSSTNLLSVNGLSDYVFRLRGGAWSRLQPVGTVQSPPLRNFISDGRDIFATPATFSCAIRCPTSLRRFDGVSWTTFGSFDGFIEDLAIVRGELHVLGRLSTLSTGLTQASRLIRRRGTAWETLLPLTDVPSTITPPGDFEIRAMNSYRDLLVVNGSFTQMRGSRLNRIAFFDGTQFSSLGSPAGVSDAGGGVNGAVSAITALEGEIYVAGAFDLAGPTLVSGIARLGNGMWHGLDLAPSVATRRINALVSHRGAVYAGGSFELPGSAGYSNVAGFGGKYWQALAPGRGASGAVNTLLSDGDALYLGGDFAQVATGGPNVLSSNGIAIWRPGQWGILGDGFASGTNGKILAVARLNGDIVVAGSFTSAGRDPAKDIARFDGSRWFRMGESTDALRPEGIRALAVYRGELYAAGTFVWADGRKPDPVLARFDGVRFQPVVNDLQTTNTFPLAKASALAVLKDRLYIGGRFDRSGATLLRGIAAYDGNQITPVGRIGAQNVQGEVMVLTVNGDELLIGGRFGSAGNQVSSGLARFVPASGAAPAGEHAEPRAH